jgi:hypothetical protein
MEDNRLARVSRVWILDLEYATGGFNQFVDFAGALLSQHSHTQIELG